jgi:hypothetical protein
MTIEKTWRIEQLTTKPTIDGNQDVVVMASWRIIGLDGTHTASVYGSSAFTSPTPGSTEYIPYSELTEDIIIQWVKASLGEAMVTDLEASVDSQIADQVTPKQQNLPLPWTVSKA